MKKKTTAYGNVGRNLLTILLPALFILFVGNASCNNDKKKTDEKVAVTEGTTSPDTVGKKFTITDGTDSAGRKVKIIDATNFNGIKYQVLDLTALGVLKEINTSVFKLAKDDLMGIFSNGDVKQLSFSFALSADGKYDVLAAGWDGAGNPITIPILLTRADAVTLRDVNLVYQKLTRGDVRSYLNPLSAPGAINDNDFADLYFYPAKNYDNSVILLMKKAAPGTPEAPIETGMGAKPIPPAPPGCDPTCDD